MAFERVNVSGILGASLLTLIFLVCLLSALVTVPTEVGLTPKEADPLAV